MLGSNYLRMFNHIIIEAKAIESKSNVIHELINILNINNIYYRERNANVRQCYSTLHYATGGFCMIALSSDYLMAHHL